MTTVPVRAYERRKSRRPYATQCEEMTLKLCEEVLHDELVRAVALALRELEPEARDAA